MCFSMYITLLSRRGDPPDWCVRTYFDILPGQESWWTRAKIRLRSLYVSTMELSTIIFTDTSKKFPASGLSWS